MSPSAIASNGVTEGVAPSATAVAHFTHLLSVETDCYDVQQQSQREHPGFILLDVRSPQLYSVGHLPGAINLPHRKITEEALAAYPPGTMYVVYCSGPHCNGADRAALRLAQLGRPVKKMIGGMTGWRDEGFEVVR
jgi:rhodanese-related sulfurtransferase